MSTLGKHGDGLPILGGFNTEGCRGVITRATSPPPHPPPKAWLTVRRTFEASPQSYMSIVRGILNARSTTERRAEDSYLAVLKDHILYLYDGDAMQECAAAIDVRSCSGLLNGELFAKRNVIVLREHEADDDESLHKESGTSPSSQHKNPHLILSMRTPPSSNLSTPCSTSSPPVKTPSFLNSSSSTPAHSRPLHPSSPNHAQRAHPRWRSQHRRRHRLQPNPGGEVRITVSPLATISLPSAGGFSIFGRKDKDANAEEKEDKTYEVSLGLAVVVKKFVGNMLVKVRVSILYLDHVTKNALRSRNLPLTTCVTPLPRSPKWKSPSSPSSPTAELSSPEICAGLWPARSPEKFLPEDFRRTGQAWEGELWG
ncbi:hypothetical protein M422DRAFT_29378 [Sphaerobolus stellatus SS14]|uniref:Unplaced genomic scaffold SPHSTscaffold_33, whole genome shotgun sequence n=1 Tax=Sphaerobolus stellatus (strain SS14) TaxID=990650 RepID=A0A0C9VU96_SPHS4|nr:hypothetical protein M422DRAFT_29378 [Sphaerobolus stellatus SS14]